MEEKIWTYLRAIPRGRVVTYGQIAAHLGNPHLARAVGNILHRNPDGEKNPCYKVVSAGGKLAQHYAFGGVDAQKRHLEQEGIPVIRDRVDLTLYRWKDDEKAPPV